MYTTSTSVQDNKITISTGYCSKIIFGTTWNDLRRNCFINYAIENHKGLIDCWKKVLLNYSSSQNYDYAPNVCCCKTSPTTLDLMTISHHIQTSMSKSSLLNCFPPSTLTHLSLYFHMLTSRTPPVWDGFGIIILKLRKHMGVLLKKIGESI